MNRGPPVHHGPFTFMQETCQTDGYPAIAGLVSSPRSSLRCQAGRRGRLLSRSYTCRSRSNAVILHAHGAGKRDFRLRTEWLPGWVESPTASQGLAAHGQGDRSDTKPTAQFILRSGLGSILGLEVCAP